jgi:hypothetical protein
MTGSLLGAALIEDNGVDEGNTPVAGYFRMAIPAYTQIHALKVLEKDGSIDATQTSLLWSSGAPGTETVLDLHDEVSLPVNVAAFEAVWSGGSVTIRWKTESESETLGYFLWRSDSSEGAFRRVASEMIAPLGAGGTGAEYTFTDAYVGLKQFWYRLEEVFFSGESVFVGPVRAEYHEHGQDAEPAKAANFPNPFYPSTRIRYRADPEGLSPDCVRIYDVQGRELVTLTPSWSADGSCDVFWNGCDAAGRETARGIYLCRLFRGSGVVETTRILKAR